MDCFNDKQFLLKSKLIYMKTVICNSATKLWIWQMCNFLEGLDVHCVFPVSDYLKALSLGSQTRYKIRTSLFKSCLLTPLYC